MTKETCLAWLKQKLETREKISANWLQHSLEFNRGIQAEVRLLKELITEVEAS